MDESDEVGGGVENSDVLEYAEVLSAHWCPRMAIDASCRWKSWNEPEEENGLPSLQRASNTSVQNSKSLSVVDVVAI